MRVRYFKAKKSHIAKMITINQTSMPENYPVQFWEQHIAKHLSWVAMVNNFVVGYALIGVLDGSPTLISFAVDQNFRQNGIGRGLLTQILTDYKGKLLRLTVRSSNFAAIDLYKQMRFTETNTLPDYYTDPSEDGIEMEFKG